MIYPFLQAKNYTPVASRIITLLCLHTMEAPEKPGTAKAVASWFAGRTAPQASAHYCIDETETWQCVREHDVAWAAPGANRQGIHLEHAGYARQSAVDWADSYSEAMLHRSAILAADICARNKIPIRFVPAADLLMGEAGITTHAEVSRAWRQTDHSDPGPNFPMAHYLNLITGASKPKGVKAMFSPPIVTEPIVADLACGTGGAWLLADSGAVYAFAGAPFRGAAEGEPYFAGRHAARLEPHGAGYTIVATSGERYDYP